MVFIAFMCVFGRAACGASCVLHPHLTCVLSPLRVPGFSSLRSSFSVSTLLKAAADITASEARKIVRRLPNPPPQTAHTCIVLCRLRALALLSLAVVPSNRVKCLQAALNSAGFTNRFATDKARQGNVPPHPACPLHARTGRTPSSVHAVRMSADADTWDGRHAATYPASLPSPWAHTTGDARALGATMGI